jgi:hypothetical protein
VTFSAGGLHLVQGDKSSSSSSNNNNTSITIAADMVERVVVFPKPDDLRTTSKVVTPLYYVLIVFRDNNTKHKHWNGSSSSHSSVMYKGKPLAQICFPLPRTCAAAEELLPSRTEQTSQRQ